MLRIIIITTYVHGKEHMKVFVCFEFCSISNTYVEKMSPIPPQKKQSTKQKHEDNLMSDNEKKTQWHYLWSNDITFNTKYTSRYVKNLTSNCTATNNGEI